MTIISFHLSIERFSEYLFKSCLVFLFVVHCYSFIISYLSAYKQINKQTMMIKKNQLIKHNTRAIEQMYQIKKLTKNANYQKTQPNVFACYPIDHGDQDEESEEGNVFKPSYPHTIDYHKKISETKKKKKIDHASEQIYHLKKNAYKNYIKEVYLKINDELKRKNTFVNVTAQNIHPFSYTDALVAKQFKPISMVKSDESVEKEMRKKMRDRFKLQKLQEETASMQRIQQKMFVIKKTSEKVVDLQIVSSANAEKTKRHTFFNKKRQNAIDQEEEGSVSIVSSKHEFSHQTVPLEKKRRQRTFTLNHPIQSSKKINPQDYIPARKIFSKKDPFVCGLNGQKQGNQEKNREKIINYLDFLWKVNFSNALFVRVPPEQTVYRAYIGNGNNSLMVKSILKRRYWWTIVDKNENCNFVWSQLKSNSFFRDCQSPSKTRPQNSYDFNPDLFMSRLMQNKRSKAQKQMSSEGIIFNNIDNALWSEHMVRNNKTELALTERTYIKRANLIGKKNMVSIQDPKQVAMHNHFEHNYFIGNKKALFYYLKKYYLLTHQSLFEAVPLTFHLAKGIDDPEYKVFLSYHSQLQVVKKQNGSEQKNIWIVKPGQFSNRGNGISVCYSLDDILIRLKGRERSSDGNPRTFIIQKYIQKPLLYKGRKFDIRHYLLLTCFNGIIKAYWYPQGYIRTSSSFFNLKRNGNPLVHLTNDAIQKHSQEYSKYEKGNKISYQKFQNYLDKHIKQKNIKNIFFDKILPQMKELSKNAVKATYLSLDQKRNEHNFQLLGMDFMIDENFQPWLIEINTNPCLELNCPLATRIIPSVIQNAFKLCLDPLFPPPQEWTTSKKNFLPDNAIEDNKFQLIFDQLTEGPHLERLFKGDYKLSANIGKIEQDAQIYENDGEEQWQTDKPQ